MESVITELLRIQLRAFKKLSKPENVMTSRTAQDRIGKLMAAANASKVDFIPEDFESFQACFVQPKTLKGGGVILYLHGGAYVAGNLSYSMGFGSVLAARTGRRVFCAAYRLAPENPYPAALDDAFEAYSHLIASGFRPGEIIFCGESAGGGLIYALALKLKALGMELPAGMIGISPWADLTMSGESFEKNENSDPSLSEDSLAAHAEMYAPGMRDDPFVSPVFADLTGFPPSLLTAGGDELLLSDAELLCGKLRAAGCPCELTVADKMWHAYVLYNINPSKAALTRIASFVRKRLPGADNGV